MLTVFSRRQALTPPGPTPYSAYFEGQDPQNFFSGIGSYIRSTSNSGGLNFTGQSVFSLSTWIAPNWSTATSWPSHFITIAAPDGYGSYNTVSLGYDNETSGDSVFVVFNITFDGQFRQTTYYAGLQWSGQNQGVVGLPPPQPGDPTSWNQNTPGFVNIQFHYDQQNNPETLPLQGSQIANAGVIYWNGQPLETHVQWTSQSGPFDIVQAFNANGPSELRIGTEPIQQFHHPHWQDNVIFDPNNVWSTQQRADAYGNGSPGYAVPGGYLFTMENTNANWYDDNAQQLTSSLQNPVGQNNAQLNPPQQDSSIYVP